MINAELNHNPYLLQTSVMFNGHPPRINSQVEKYDAITLKDWIEKVPQIFHDEMNGYDFDLNFTGTKSDFETLCDTFTRAGITNDMVRLFHKNELVDAETKSAAIDSLIQWLRDNPNRKFDFDAFYAANEELFEGSYPYIVINGHSVEQVHPQVSVELVKTANELQDTVLTNTPILFFVEPSSTKLTRSDLLQILRRKDVQQNQLFFMLHPQLNAAQVRRVITDLGVESPQIVSTFDAESILNYLRNYPITEFIRNAIIVFEDITTTLAERLEIENKDSLIQNAEIHAVIDSIEQQIARIKDSDLFFTERDNFNVGHVFSELSDSLKEQVTKWRNRKTKIVGDSECAVAASEYDTDIAKYMVNFISSVKEACRRISNEIATEFAEEYRRQGLEPHFLPAVKLEETAPCQSVSLADGLISLKKITYEEQKYDLIALFGFSGTKEEKEPVRVATCYYAEWREFAWNQIRPIVVDFLNQNFTQLANYYDALATAYHEKLASLLADQESEKDKVSAQLSDDERKLQEDNDWLAEFKDQLVRIERG